MFRSLKNKLLGIQEPIEVIQESSNQREEPSDQIEELVEEESYEKTSNDLQQESVNLEVVNEDDFLDMRTTRSMQLEYKDVLSKLDSMVERVEPKEVELTTIEKLQLESNFISGESETEDINEDEIFDIQKEKLIAEGQFIKKNSDTFLINEGMFDLNSQLHNAKLIIEDTEIPQAVTKEQVLNPSKKN